MSGTRQASTNTERPRLSDSEDRTAVSTHRKDSLQSRRPTLFSRSRSRGRAEEKRPATAGRFSRSKSRSRKENEEPKRQLSFRRTRSTSHREEAAKDLTSLPPPQLTQLDCTTVNGDTSMIGVALGSPSQLRPTYPGTPGQSPLGKMNTEFSIASDQYLEDPANRNKGASWKKIGGLFKAKNALLNEQVPSPLYQLQVQHATQLRSGTDSSVHSQADPGPGDHDARHLFDKILGSNGQLAPKKYLDNPLQQTSRLWPSKQHLSPAGLPLLDVKIPDVQMERYSVMFGSLLEKQEPSTLLSRRDKTLNKLMTIPDEIEGPSRGKPVQKQQLGQSEATSNAKDNTHLPPQAHAPYPRRATSPTLPNSPSFSLFPHLPQAAEKILGPIPPAKQNPLQRSYTAPSRLSPMQESFGLDEVRTLKPGDPKDNVAASPPPTASTSDPKRASSNPSNPSIPSPTSTRSSLNEDLLLNIKTSGSLKKKQQEDDEVNEYQDLKVPPLKPRHLANNALNGTAQDEKVEMEVREAKRPTMHEDTLAALERPRSIESKSRGSSSLKPSKARIDQIMRGAPTEDLSKACPKRAEPEVGSENLQKVVTAPFPRAQTGSDTIKATISKPTVATSPTRKQKLATIVHDQEATSVPRRTHLTSHDQAIQQPSGNPQSSMLDGSTTIDTLERQPPFATHFSSNADQISTRLPARQPPPSSQTERRRPGQSIDGQAQRPSVAKVPCGSHPKTNAAITNPSLNASNRAFPHHRPLPRNHALYPRVAFNRTHPQGPGNHSIKTSKMEKDQDNILDYYLDNNEAKPPSQRPRSQRRLQKRLSDKSKQPLSLSNKPIPDPISPPNSSDTGPRSPIPISKYSANAAHKPLIPPNITSPSHLDHRSESKSYLDPSHPSPAVRAAREKAAQLVKTSSVADSSFTQTYSRSISTSNPPLQPRQPLVELSLTFDAPKTDSNTAAKGETSFYLHSNASTPTLENVTDPLTQTPSATSAERCGSQPLSQSSNRALPQRSSSRGGSLSSLPSPAGGIDSRSTTSKPVPPQPTRSASAGTVGTRTAAGTCGIQGHLKPEKGEKVVERQAGLMPTIVDPERHPEKVGFAHHRVGKSVNLVIESV